MFILVSLLVIELPRDQNIVKSTTRLGAPFHVNCHFKQLGTQSQTRTLGTRQIDLETDFICFDNELDHPSQPSELWHVTDG
jgi:hypothetical protein